MESIPKSFDESWHPHVQDLFETPEMKKLKYEILKTDNFYPKKEDIFNVFRMSLNRIRVVVIGFDPYPSNNYANGYAFATNRTDNKPFSLRIIESEVGHVLKNDLSNWVEQGLFLLNTSLTVEKDKPGSHHNYWRNFISNIISIISTEINPIWLLWGNQAKDYEELIKYSTVTAGYNSCIYPFILKASHPASEAKNRSGGFLGCNHFNKVNEYLESIGEKTIIW